jgi:uncharacterized membrane protein YraQ (UPF0718 family)
MLELPIEWFRETLDLFVRTAPYLLFGFLAAGLIHALIPTRRLAGWLGGDRWTSVARASLIGVPLPLCSCAVVPVAAALRKRGASRGATSAFLISTPESGVDSIAVTYALIDPIMTVARPIAAFFTAFVAGIAQNFSTGRSTRSVGDAVRGRDADHGSAAGCPDCGSPDDGDCGCQSTAGVCADEACGSRCADDAPETRIDSKRHRRFAPRLRDGARYGLVDLFNDLAGYLVVGFVIAGLLAVLLTRVDVLRAALESPWAMLLMLAAGVPMYVCAAAVTPMVAVMIYQGLSPGAALIFLLVGPATNAASIALLYRILGRRAVVIYLASIVASALLLGVALNVLYAGLDISPRASVRTAQPASASWFSIACAVALIALIVRALWSKYVAGKSEASVPAADSLSA